MMCEKRVYQRRRQVSGCQARGKEEFSRKFHVTITLRMMTLFYVLLGEHRAFVKPHRTANCKEWTLLGAHKKLTRLSGGVSIATKKKLFADF
jgi:hypothetical protein